MKTQYRKEKKKRKQKQTKKKQKTTNFYKLTRAPPRSMESNDVLLCPTHPTVEAETGVRGQQTKSGAKPSEAQQEESTRARKLKEEK